MKLKLSLQNLQDIIKEEVQFVLSESWEDIKLSDPLRKLIKVIEDWMRKGYMEEAGKLEGPTLKLTPAKFVKDIIMPTVFDAQMDAWSGTPGEEVFHDSKYASWPRWRKKFHEDVATEIWDQRGKGGTWGDFENLDTIGEYLYGKYGVPSKRKVPATADKEIQKLKRLQADEKGAAKEEYIDVGSTLFPPEGEEDDRSRDEPSRKNFEEKPPLRWSYEDMNMSQYRWREKFLLPTIWNGITRIFNKDVQEKLGISKGEAKKGLGYFLHLLSDETQLNPRVTKRFDGMGYPSFPDFRSYRDGDRPTLEFDYDFAKNKEDLIKVMAYALFHGRSDSYRGINEKVREDVAKKIIDKIDGMSHKSRKEGGMGFEKGDLTLAILDLQDEFNPYRWDHLEENEIKEDDPDFYEDFFKENKMKLTRKQLTKIIQEEMQKILEDDDDVDMRQFAATHSMANPWQQPPAGTPDIELLKKQPGDMARLAMMALEMVPAEQYESVVGIFNDLKNEQCLAPDAVVRSLINAGFDINSPLIDAPLVAITHLLSAWQSGQASGDAE